MAAPGFGRSNSAPTPSTPNDDELLDSYSRAVIEAADRAGPAVVKVDVEPRGSGSGFLFAPDGLVATNSHVVAEAKRIRVTMLDGSTYRADRIGDDPDSDIAVLRLCPANPATFPFVVFADSSRLRPGQVVVAI